MNRIALFLTYGALVVSSLAHLSCRSNTAQATDLSKQAPKADPPGGRRVVKTDAEWKKILKPDQFYVLREKGTERAGSSSLNDIHEKGTFVCAACKNPLFSADAKFDSGTGWPSFFQPIAKNAVKEAKDYAFGMTRIEIMCSVCDGHLGHVFDDGPKPTGLRYCMNGTAMQFVKKQ
ncbi:peptide-methionine (R)-S-oxide reductase MsrB [Rudanella paleaurantiibacter]|uniref:peptide-methionine (R)-S-oxide reductase n=1 Tax=Rudanella paleaurantiibacter TaxID=2614655 RepID=A0A7J5U041_9BACT|nr:peptide-methionine (R)-S-oxide reductase MsrB [Rudanella paleaurantiibacter]KAB7731113.1 peptide-methionine (R)-S-oxide reductase MsrB [Rudanella paleaurantiibacter]